MERASLSYIFFTFLKLGATAFGGYMSLVAIVKDTSFTASTRVFLMIPPVNVLQIWLTLSIQDTPHFPSIRKLRLRDRLSQEELAQRVGVRRETIGHLENGHYNPSLKLAMDIAHVFGCTVEDIFSFED